MGGALEQDEFDIFLGETICHFEQSGLEFGEAFRVISIVLIDAGSYPIGQRCPAIMAESQSEPSRITEAQEFRPFCVIQRFEYF